MEVESLKYISQVQDLLDLGEYVQDEDLQKAIDTALHLIVDPEVPSAKAARLVVKFQAYSLKFKMMAVTFMGIKAGTEAAKQKKNVYYSLSEQCHELSDALKILARYGA